MQGHEYQPGPAHEQDVGSTPEQHRQDTTLIEEWLSVENHVPPQKIAARIGWLKRSADRSVVDGASLLAASSLFLVFSIPLAEQFMRFALKYPDGELIVVNAAATLTSTLIGSGCLFFGVNRLAKAYQSHAEAAALTGALVHSVLSTPSPPMR